MNQPADLPARQAQDRERGQAPSQARKLALVPCAAAWSEMRPVAGGRHCPTCDRTVVELAALDEAALGGRLERPGERICARVELDGARPRTRLGLAAGLSVVVLSGCASATVPSPSAAPSLSPYVYEAPDADESPVILLGALVDERQLSTSPASTTSSTLIEIP